MPTFKVTPFLQHLSAPRQRILRAPIALSSRYQWRTFSDYGGGEGDPKGENPQNQGSNPSAELEHPGPPPPSVGQGTGGGPTKAGESGHKQDESSKGVNKATSEQKSVSGSEPKILGENDPKHSEDVRAHNEDMKKRHDRPQEGVEPDAKDNVDKSFWSGRGGADQNP